MKQLLGVIIVCALFQLLISSCSPVSQMQPNVVTGGLAVAIDRHPLNNSEFIVASETGGLFKSANSGVNWKQVSCSRTFWFTDVKYCIADPSIIIATASRDTKVSNGGGIWRSSNSGSDWFQITLTTPVAGCANELSAYCIAIEPTNKIWVGTSCGLAYSTDNGLTFTFIPQSTNYNTDKVYAVLAPETNQLKILTDAGVKVSTDDGVSWSYSNTGLPYIAKGRQSQLSCSPLNHQHIFWASNFSPYDGKWHNGIYYSTDNGNSWTNLINNIGINRAPTCYTALSLSGDADKFDLYYSDGGCTLQRASFSNTNPPIMSGSWTNLNHPHCDFADLCFKTDGKSPALLVGDGGIFSTTNNGANWQFTGGGDHGYNALQITEVTGQLHSTDSKSDLYYGTQDNNLSASSDEGLTWPDANRFCCEGFFLNIPRESLPASQTKISGVDCGACFNFISGPLFSGVSYFPNVLNATGPPRLIKPGSYIQSDTLPGAPTVSIFSLTTNTGSSWNQKYAFTNQPRDLSKISPNFSAPVIFTAVRNSGTTPDGYENVGIKKIVGILSSGAPIVSDITGFGSLGVFPTMFAWYKPFGVDPVNPNHIIVPDITTEKVRVTFDGGATWNDDNDLTNLVTQSGVFKFRWNQFTQISNISFDPDVPRRILVGTVQAGIFVSCNNGTSWSKVEDSEQIPKVSSFYFLGDNKVVVSSYGRGLWKLSLSECPTLRLPHLEKFYWEGPMIYWKGAWVPIWQIHDPEVCPVCGFFIIEHGDIARIIFSNEGEAVEKIEINGGNMKGYSYGKKEIETLPFKISNSSQNFDAGKDENLAAALKNGYKIKGVYLDGSVFKGYILSKEDITIDQIPTKQELKTYLNAEVIRSERTDQVTSIRLTGKGYDSTAAITISVDGSSMDVQKSKVHFDKKGNMSYDLALPLTPGGHTILVEQKTPLGTIREATTVIIPLNDSIDKERK